jgi:hypothetical protein
MQTPRGIKCHCAFENSHSLALAGLQGQVEGTEVREAGHRGPREVMMESLNLI